MIDVKSEWNEEEHGKPQNFGLGQELELKREALESG
jgi:hypothetical protein